MRIVEIIINNLYRYGLGVQCVLSPDTLKMLISGVNNDESGCDSNGSGKSSIPNVVAWLIFGNAFMEQFQEENASEIIRRGETCGSGKITLTNDVNTLIIERGTGKKKSQQFLKVMYNGEDKTCTTMTKTQEELLCLLNIAPSNKPKDNITDFLNTTYLSTATVKGFISKKTTSKERFALVERFLNLKTYTDASNMAKANKLEILTKIEGALEDIAYKETALSAMNEEQYLEFIEGKEKEIKIVSDEIVVLEKNIASEAGRTKIATEIQELTTHIANKKTATEEHYKTLKDSHNQNAVQIQTLSSEGNQYNTDLKVITDNEPAIALKRSQLIELQTGSQELQAEHLEVASNIATQTSEITLSKSQINDYTYKTAQIDKLKPEASAWVSELATLTASSQSWQTQSLEFARQQAGLTSDIEILKLQIASPLACPECKTSVMHIEGKLMGMDSGSLKAVLSSKEQALAQLCTQIKSDEARIQRESINIKKLQILINQFENQKATLPAIDLEAVKEDLVFKEAMLESSNSRSKEIIEQNSDISQAIPILEKDINDFDTTKSVFATRRKPEIVQQDINTIETKNLELEKSSSDLMEQARADVGVMNTSLQEKTKLQMTLGTGVFNVTVLAQEITDKTAMITAHNQAIGQYHAQIKNIADMVKELSELKSKIAVEKKKADVYGFWEIGFKEIKLSIIDEFLPDFEDQINKNLSALKVGMQIDFDTKKQKAKVSKKDIERGTTNKEEFNVRVLMDNGDESPLNMMSQGERGRVGMCAGFGLREMTADRGNNLFDFVFIDEIADSLDATGLMELIRLLDGVPGQKFVISHNEELKNYFDTTITAVRTNDVSTIEQ